MKIVIDVDTDNPIYHAEGIDYFMPDLHAFISENMFKILKEKGKVLPKGRWIPPENEMAQKYGKAYSFRCSECGKIVHTECFIVISEFDYKFCPYCSAKMEAEK